MECEQTHAAGRRGPGGCAFNPLLGVADELLAAMVAGMGAERSVFPRAGLVSREFFAQGFRGKRLAQTPRVDPRGRHPPGALPVLFVDYALELHSGVVHRRVPDVEILVIAPSA